jgi:hypothetical protein
VVCRLHSGTKPILFEHVAYQAAISALNAKKWLAVLHSVTKPMMCDDRDLSNGLHNAVEEAMTETADASRECRAR